MINRLVIFGATGDLTARYLLPGIAALRAAGRLPKGFRLTGAGREDWDDETFRDWASEQLGRHADDIAPAERAAVVSASSYRRADVADTDSVAAAVAGEGPVAAYLALPPFVFPAAVSSLHEAGLPDGSRIVLEKPFGESLDDAIALNRLLAEVVPEQGVFRVDHFLAMTTVQNVLGSRLANRVLEPIWNSTHIAGIDIVWEESLALEGRAGYYDGVGALKDMLQNHLLQLLCLAAMEPPVSFDERDLRDHKVDVLRLVRPLTGGDVLRHTRRGRYLAGQIDGHEVPAYVDEDGVDPGHHTETFAEVELELDNWRWQGTTFRLRAAKAFARDRKEVAVRFRQVPHLPFGQPDQAQAAPANVLRFGLEPEDLRLEMSSVGTDPGTLAPLAMTAQLPPPGLPAYGQLLLNVLNQDARLSIRGDEAEESWRVLAPVIDGWSRDVVPMEEYAAGSLGPRLRSRPAERIFYRQHAEAAPVLEVFRHQAFRAGLDSCLDDQRVPKGEGVLFFESARGDYELRPGSDGAPLSVGRHDGPRLRPRHGWLEFPGHDGVELLQYLSAQGTAAVTPQLSK
jgi:glucose-6-phosphate 1-dehydrogenase